MSKVQNGSVRTIGSMLSLTARHRPEILAIQDPARLNWKPQSKIEQYQVGASELLKTKVP
jgi:hypothetical protein